METCCRNDTVRADFKKRKHTVRLRLLLYPLNLWFEEKKTSTNKYLQQQSIECVARSQVSDPTKPSTMSSSMESRCGDNQNQHKGTQHVNFITTIFWGESRLPNPKSRNRYYTPVLRTVTVSRLRLHLEVLTLTPHLQKGQRGGIQEEYMLYI